MISGPAPQIASSALHDPLHATVIVEVKIDQEGHVVQMELINRPEPNLEAAARKAISQWRFKPTIIDGQPVFVRSVISLTMHPERY